LIPPKSNVTGVISGGDEIVEGDIADVSVDELPRQAVMAWASFPCQDLSLAGWRRGLDADRSGAYWPFWRLMRNLHDEGKRPPLIVLENVLGLLGAGFEGLCDSLAALDMQYGALVVDAKHFVPQSRPRVFVVAADARLDLTGVCTGGPTPGTWFPPSVIRAKRALTGVAASLWRWWRLPHPEMEPEPAETLLEAVDAVEWDDTRRTEEFVGRMAPLHQSKLDQLSRSDRTAGFAYQRTRDGVLRAELRIDGLAGCLRTPSGGSSRQIVVSTHGDSVHTRLITARETSRLMGVPDTYALPDSYTEAYHVMGDGVAVPVVSWLSDQLLTPISGAWEAQRGALGRFEPPDPPPQEKQLFFL